MAKVAKSRSKTKSRAKKKKSPVPRKKSVQKKIKRLASLKKFFSRSVKKIVKKPVRKLVKKSLPLAEEMKPTAAETMTSGGQRGEETGLEPEIQEVQVPAQPQVGDPAPEFTLMNDQGESVSLAGFRGKKVVLYFYPKDDTPGCTKEACAFRDGISEIQARGAIILGMSADSVKSHQAFKQKYDLNFPLLSDVNKEVVNVYGVWKEKSMYGRTFMGIERTTFVIDESGRIARIFPKVDVERHYQEVLAAL